MRCDKLHSEVMPKVAIDGKGKATVLNTFQWPRSEVVNISANEATTLDTGTQKTTSGNVLVAVNAKATAASILSKVAVQTSKVSLTQVNESYVLENEKIKVTIVGGEITSLVDLDLDRELVPEGQKGNKLVLFYDQAMTFWDAWDVEIYHLEMPEYLGAGTVKVLESGPLRASLEIHHKISEESWIKSIITLDAYQAVDSPQHDMQSLLKVDCEVEWHECRRFLKVEFPWEIYRDHATYDTQFGVVRSPTHYNTSWDYAKFEVVCHRFADLSEYGYGVSILNDCKYGFETQGNVQRLSLLRSPKGPDPNADMGRQVFKYAVAPHRGSFMEAAVTRAGLNFNNELRVVDVSDVEKINQMLSAIKIEGPSNIMLSNVKRAEDDEDLDGHYRLKRRAGKSIILRIYEGLGGAGRATIRT